MTNEEIIKTTAEKHGISEDGVFVIGGKGYLVESGVFEVWNQVAKEHKLTIIDFGKKERIRELNSDEMLTFNFTGKRVTVPDIMITHYFEIVVKAEGEETERVFSMDGSATFQDCDIATYDGSAGVLNSMSLTRAMLRTMRRLCGAHGHPISTTYEEMPTGSSAVNERAEALEDPGSYVITLPKAREINPEGLMIKDLYQVDPGYIEWIASDDFEGKGKNAVAKECAIAYLKEIGGEDDIQDLEPGKEAPKKEAVEEDLDPSRPLSAKQIKTLRMLIMKHYPGAKGDGAARVAIENNLIKTIIGETKVVEDLTLVEMSWIGGYITYWVERAAAADLTLDESKAEGKVIASLAREQGAWWKDTVKYVGENPEALEVEVEDDGPDPADALDELYG